MDKYKKLTILFTVIIAFTSTNAKQFYDNFESYTHGSDLSNYPPWETIMHDSLIVFKWSEYQTEVTNLNRSQCFNAVVGIGMFRDTIVKAGFYFFDPNEHEGSFYLLARFSSNKGYAFCYYDLESLYYEPKTIVSILCYKDGQWITLVQKEYTYTLSKNGKFPMQYTFSVTGYNPVHLSAGGLSYDDYTYNIKEGYAGIGAAKGYYLYACGLFTGEFFVEGEPTYITPTSIGTVKALFK